MIKIKKSFSITCLAFIFSIISSCGSIDSPNTEEDNKVDSVEKLSEGISKEMLEVSTVLLNKTYTYIPVAKYLECSIKNSITPIIKNVAIDSKENLISAFKSDDEKKAKDALNRVVLGEASLSFDKGIKDNCKLEELSEKSISEEPEKAEDNSIKSEKIRLEAESSVKTGGILKYPVVEPRRTGEKVMMFSGGDKGGQATLKLPELKGSFNIKMSWLNSPDSPAMELMIGSVKIDIPDSKTINTNSLIEIRDLGNYDLNLNEGDSIVMTVKGESVGIGNAWIGIDYFEFIRN